MNQPESVEIDANLVIKIMLHQNQGRSLQSASKSRLSFQETAGDRLTDPTSRRNPLRDRAGVGAKAAQGDKAGNSFAKATRLRAAYQFVEPNLVNLDYKYDTVSRRDADYYKCSVYPSNTEFGFTLKNLSPNQKISLEILDEDGDVVSASGIKASTTISPSDSDGYRLTLDGSIGAEETYYVRVTSKGNKKASYKLSYYFRMMF
jgi:hypothetical protein